MPEELAELRAEIERLLSRAIRDEQRHEDVLEQRDQDHADELEARDEAHLQETEAFRRALETRDLFGQAKGVLMTSLGCSPEAAFDLIVKQSQHENRKASEIAAEIVERARNRAAPTRHRAAG